jgi:hypothetical protein
MAEAFLKCLCDFGYLDIDDEDSPWGTVVSERFGVPFGTRFYIRQSRDDIEVLLMDCLMIPFVSEEEEEMERFTWHKDPTKKIKTIKIEFKFLISEEKETNNV